MSTWTQQRRLNPETWLALRTPAGGEAGADGSHHFIYDALLSGSSGEQEEVSISLVTRATDGALGCAEATC
jgi:hypothetical protein